MRTLWKRAAAGLLLAGLVGSAALALPKPGDVPAKIPPIQSSEPAVIPVQATETIKVDPAVALEWVGPPVVKANKPAEYVLTVKNACGQSLQKVVVQVRAPKDVTVAATDPAVEPVDGVYLWELGTLAAKESKPIKMTLSRSTKGDLACQAWVTFTGTASMKASVKEPKLSVSIKLPETAILGDKIPVEYSVENTGDIAADDVALKLAGSIDAPAGRTLKPGERFKQSSELQATAGGKFTYEAIAIGADGLIASAKATVLVQVPKLDVSIAGPDEKMLGKKATYTVTVRNCGDVPIAGVIVREHVPAHFRVAGTGKDGVLAPGGDLLTWSAGDLLAGAVKSFEFEGSATQAGTLSHHVDASGDRGTKATGQCRTAVDGIPALRMELVDRVDPVETGGETSYEIKVTNTGTKADANIAIACELPKEFEFVSCSGPTDGKKVVGIKIDDPEKRGVVQVVFEPVAELGPKTEASFTVKVKAKATGDVRFKATMTSKHLTSPVTKEESTRVYGD